MPGTDFKSLQIKKLPRIKGELTQEARYWNKFKNSQVDKIGSAVTEVAFQMADPYDFCVTSGTKVILYSGQTKRKLRTYSRFTDTAYGGILRDDGMLMAAGSEKGLVKVFDVGKKLMLRQMSGHTGAVHAVCFTDTSGTLLSASDDKTIRLWDITTGNCLKTLTGHSDYVRSLHQYRSTPYLYLSGSYDGTARLWDSRDHYASILTLSHPNPLECVYSHSSSKYIYTASGNSVYVWDIFKPDQPVTIITNHIQAVTSICCTNNMLLSSSLDGYVKVVDTTTYSFKHDMNFNAPLLSFSISPDGRILVAGSSDGTLYIKEKQKEGVTLAPMAVRRSNTHEYYVRGENVGADADAIIATKKQKVKLASWDKCLKEFKYHKALDAAMNSKQPAVIVSVLEELRQRNGLQIALGGREGSDLENILSFFLKYISYPSYSLPICDCVAVVLDLYSPEGGRSSVLDDFISKLYKVIHQELQFEEDVMSVIGIMNSLHH